MARTSAAMFIPLFESLILSLICYFAMYAFFSSTVAADFTPCMRAMLFCSLVLNVGTGFLELAISAAQKSERIVVASAASAVSYRHALGVGNAHCCSSALLLLLHLSMFLQAAVYGESQLNSSTWIQRSNSYFGTQQADWMHAVVGASGGWIFSRDREAYVVPSSPVVAPFMGSIYSGIVLAYLSLMFLVSIYISYMATPEMASSYLFMEPRYLLDFITRAQLLAEPFHACAGATQLLTTVRMLCKMQIPGSVQRLPCLWGWTDSLRHLWILRGRCCIHSRICCLCSCHLLLRRHLHPHGNQDPCSCKVAGIAGICQIVQKIFCNPFS